MNKKFAASILCISFVVLMSGCGLFKKEPQTAVNDGFVKFAETKKMSTAIVLNGTIASPTGEKTSNVKFWINATGNGDITDQSAPKTDMKVNVKVQSDDFNGSGDVLVRNLDRKFFFNVTNINVPGSSGDALKTQLASMLNVWWALPVGENSELNKTTEEQKQLLEKLQDGKFFNNAVEDGQEEVNSIKCTRYRVDLDKGVLKNFILEIARVGGNQPTPDEENAIQESLNEVAFSGAVLVGDDGAIHKIRGTVTSQPKQGPSSLFEFDVSGWDYGKTVTIAAPESSQEFNPMMFLQLFGALNTLDTSEAAGTTTLPVGKKDANAAVKMVPAGTK